MTTGRAPSLRSLCRLLAITVWVLAATGCAVVPGMRMDSGPDERFVPDDADAEAFAASRTVIDADLLRTQAEQLRNDREHAQSSRVELIRDYDYRIAPGDTLMVFVMGHPEFSNPAEFRVSDLQGRLVRSDGSIFFPYIGIMQVAGDTIEEVRARIAQRLAPFITEPQVDLRVSEFRGRQVYVTGEVGAPGVIPMNDVPLTAMDAINAAGGLAETADRRRLEITRDGEQIRLDALELYSRGHGDLLLEDRDVVYVPDNRFNRVFVLGETQGQAAVELVDGQLSLAETLSEVGGLRLDTANTRHIFVMRGQPVFDADTGEEIGIRPEIYHLDATSAVALLLAERFVMQPRDIVFVSASGWVRFVRNVQQITPVIQALWQTDRILRD